MCLLLKKKKGKKQEINQRKYVEYLLRNGTMEEKRQLLGGLKNKLVLTNGFVRLDTNQRELLK
jgi:hypothetical protein